MTAIIIILACGLIAIIGLCVYLFYMGVVRFPESKSSAGGTEQAWGQHFAKVHAGHEWVLAQSPERLELTSSDGLKLCAYYIRTPGARRNVICMHGYRGSGLIDFGCIAQFFAEHGFNVLIPDQRAHGVSAGKYICYGVSERGDCRDWAYKLNTLDAGHCDTILYGVSMGAATVLMSSALDLPHNVRGIIADCGFTSPRAIMIHVMRSNTKLPIWTLMPLLRLLLKWFAHFDIDGASTLDAMKVNRLPVLFIHGDADTFVPVSMTRENYAACTAPKQLEIFEGAAHAMSLVTDPERYHEAVLGFVEEYAPGR